MSRTEGFVTFSQMDSFIKDNNSIQNISTLFNRAKNYFTETSTIKDYIVSSLYQSESSLKSKHLINYVINNQSIVTMFYHQMNETLSPF